MTIVLYGSKEYMLKGLSKSKLWEAYIHSLNPSYYLPLAKMQKGVSGNLVSWNGASPITGWNVSGSALSEVTTPTPPVSVKCLKVSDNYSTGAYSCAVQTKNCSKIQCITATLSAQCQAASVNTMPGNISIYADATFLNACSALIKDDLWHIRTASARLPASLSNLGVRLFANSSATPDSTSNAYFDDVVFTIPQMLGCESAHGIYHPDVVSLQSFNGGADLITSEVDNIGTNACVIMATIKPTGLGGGNQGFIITNGKIILRMGGSGTLVFTRNNETNDAISSNNAVSINNTFRIIVFCTSVGLASIFINRVLSGAANQNSGTPVAGTSLLTFGNALTGNRGFAGPIYDVEVLTGLPCTIASASPATFVAYDYAIWRKCN